MKSSLKKWWIFEVCWKTPSGSNILLKLKFKPAVYQIFTLSWAFFSENLPKFSEQLFSIKTVGGSKVFKQLVWNDSSLWNYALKWKRCLTVIPLKIFSPYEHFFSNITEGAIGEVFCKKVFFFARSPCCGHWLTFSGWKG